MWWKLVWCHCHFSKVPPASSAELLFHQFGQQRSSVNCSKSLLASSHANGNRAGGSEHRVCPVSAGQSSGRREEEAPHIAPSWWAKQEGRKFSFKIRNRNLKMETKILSPPLGRGRCLELILLRSAPVLNQLPIRAMGSLSYASRLVNLVHFTWVKRSGSVRVLCEYISKWAVWWSEGFLIILREGDGGRTGSIVII